MNHRLTLSKLYSWVALGAFTVGASACQAPPEQVPIRSLRASGEATFLCRSASGQGLPLDDCPQDALGTNELYSLITQTASAEVAVVRVAGTNEQGNSTAGVVDVDPSNPGVTPLRVGAKPQDIVTTPGGVASFVSVADEGRFGIFGLPTSCITAPEPREDGTRPPRRDVTTWPACSLPSAPGAIAVLVDPANAEGQVRTSCSSDFGEVSESSSAAEREECPADLSQEDVVSGRSKLAVALPELGHIAVLDAQSLLDREPGSFAPCDIEAWHRLSVDVPATIEQPIPEDLVVDQCVEPVMTYGPFEGPFEAEPSDMAADGEGLLYVADQGAPLVHVLDVSDPCALGETAPLLPVSFKEPERVVTTNRVAVSPLTTRGERFVYAIDDRGDGTASVMVFDVSEGQMDRTPLVREGAPYMPLEPPDRIQLAASAKDVTFALHDIPVVDPATGEAVVGTRCNPDPSIDPDSPAALYRPSSDGSEGAGPRTLRGVFAFILMSNGQVAVVDVDDFDSDCRRPVTTNQQGDFDFRGCSNDPETPEFYTVDGDLDSPPTVTDEASCRVVQPHRVRSGNLLKTGSSGAGAPGLRAFPRLSQRGRGLPVTSQTAAGRRNPRMLGVDFENADPNGAPIPAEVYVGTTLLERGDSTDDLLIDPALAERPSIVVPFVAPRAFPSSETVSVTYEGPLAGESFTGFYAEATGPERTFSDSQALYCEMGVQGVELARDYGVQQFGLSGDAADRFAERHADYVQITTELLPEDDSYWDEGGAACVDGGGYNGCLSLFGPADADELDPSRDLQIVRAFQNELTVEPRGNLSDEEKAARAEGISCCFPTALSYRVRGGAQWIVVGSATGFEHAITAEEVVGDDGITRFPCVQDCSAEATLRQGRAFEISSVSCDDPDPESMNPCSVGPRDVDEDVVCFYDATTGPVEPNGQASECIFDGTTRRFAVYRGLDPSERDMAFTFDVQGGFRGQSISLLTQGTVTILPVSIQAVPGYNQLAVVDSQDRGLMMLSLRSVAVGATFF